MINADLYYKTMHAHNRKVALPTEVPLDSNWESYYTYGQLQFSKLAEAVDSTPISFDEFNKCINLSRLDHDFQHNDNWMLTHKNDRVP